jgi:hypothetical protein
VYLLAIVDVVDITANCSVIVAVACCLWLLRCCFVVVDGRFKFHVSFIFDTIPKVLELWKHEACA